MKKRLLKYLGVTLLLISALALLAASIVWFTFREPSSGGKSLSAWLADLESSNPKQQAEAKAAILAMGTNSIPFLVAEFDQQDNRLRETLSHLLQKQSFVKVSIPTRHQRMVRAARALEVLESLGTPAIPLLKPLIDRNPGYVTDALSRIGTNALPTLFETLASTNPIVQNNTVPSLQNMINRGQATPRDIKLAVPLAIQMLQSTNENSRWRAGSLLATIGAEAPDAVIPLERALARESHPSVKEEIIKALAQIDPVHSAQPALDAFRLQLQSSNPQIRIATAVDIVQLPPETVAAVPLLIQCLGDPDETVRMVAVEALGNFRSQPDIAVPALITALSDTNKVIRSKSARSLGQYGRLAQTALPSLKRNAQTDIWLSARVLATAAIDTIVAQTATNSMPAK